MEGGLLGENRWELPKLGRLPHHHPPSGASLTGSRCLPNGRVIEPLSAARRRRRRQNMLAVGGSGGGGANSVGGAAQRDSAREGATGSCISTNFLVVAIEILTVELLGCPSRGG